MPPSGPDRASAAPSAAEAYCRSLLRASRRFCRDAHHTASRRRLRRTAGRSWESTIKPSGIIQKPRMGKNPSVPPTTSAEPVAILPTRERGMARLHFPRLRRPVLWSIPNFIPSCPFASALWIIFSPAISPENRDSGDIKQEECVFFEKTAWQIGKAFVLPRSHRAKQRTFPGSSAVEHSTVNRMAVGSNPTRGANNVLRVAGNQTFPAPYCLTERRGGDIPSFATALFSKPLASVLTDASQAERCFIAASAMRA